MLYLQPARRHLDRGPATGARAIRGRTRTQGAATSRDPRPADRLACSYDPGSRERRPGYWITDAWPAALTTYLGRQIRLASSQVTARHPNHEEAAALALPSDAAVLVREDIYQDRRGIPVDFTRTVWPGDTTRLVIGD